jgi:hypothetical protein
MFGKQLSDRGVQRVNSSGGGLGVSPQFIKAPKTGGFRGLNLKNKQPLENNYLT